jgi:ABC-type uncharacterized transport system permease subunit
VKPMMRQVEWLSLYAASVAAALGVSAILIRATGGDSFAVFDALIEGSLTGSGRWGLTLGAAAPMLLVALGTIVSARAGLVNIGQEGQLLIGTAFAVYFGFRIGGPGPFNLVVLLVAGSIGGALWAGVAGVLRFRRGVPEVLSTLLLVTVASQVTAYALGREWLLLASNSVGARNNVSEQLAEDNRLPNLNIFGNQIPSSFFLGVVFAVIVAFALARTVWGFQLRMLGRSPQAAQRAGVSQRSFGMRAMLTSGAFAGLAGTVMFAGGGFQFSNYKFVPGFSGNIGWTGLLVALVARERAMPAIAVAIAFGALRTGSSFVGSTGVEARVTEVIEGLLVLALLVPPAVMFIRDRRRARAATTART